VAGIRPKVGSALIPANGEALQNARVFLVSAASLE
jgi:hypothetical protein